MLKAQPIDYHDDDVLLEGYCVINDKSLGQRPAILVCHDWSGKNEFACRKAEKLAELGYVGFAIDMYGKGKLGKTKDEKMTLMQPFMQNRIALQKRLLAAYETIKKLDFVDDKKIAAIGFCFGGLCALDLARSEADIKGVVSFHGLLGAPENIAKNTIKAKILALCGYDDPMVPPKDIIAFGDEMTQAKADWELDIYGNTMHAFTNPEANDPDFGTVYNKQADHRSWITMQTFFQELFKD